MGHFQDRHRPGCHAVNFTSVRFKHESAYFRQVRRRAEWGRHVLTAGDSV